MEGRGTPGWAFSREESGGPVEAHPPTLILVDGEEKTEGRRGLGRGREGCRVGYRVFWRGLASEEGAETIAKVAEEGTAPEDGGEDAGPGSAVYERYGAEEGDEDTRGDEEGEREPGDGEDCGRAEEGMGWERVEVGEDGEGGEVCEGGLEDGLGDGERGRGAGGGEGDGEEEREGVAE